MSPSTNIDEPRDDQVQCSSSSRTSRLIADRWKLGKRLGSGQFGEVFVATDVCTGERVAVKLESNRTNSLQHEHIVYKALQKSSSTLTGFADVLYYSREDDCCALVMTRLGPSLQRMLEHCGGKFSATTILTIGLQVVNCLQQLHDAGYSHEDISPENLLIADSDPRAIYLVDFGISMKLYDLVAALAKRLDVLSLAVELMKMLNGCQDSSSINFPSAAWTKRACKKEVHELCKDVPELERFFEIAFQSNFKKDSDYERLREVLRTGLQRRQRCTETVLDWLSSH